MVTVVYPHTPKFLNEIQKQFQKGRTSVSNAAIWKMMNNPSRTFNADEICDWFWLLQEKSLMKKQETNSFCNYV